MALTHIRVHENDLATMLAVLNEDNRDLRFKLSYLSLNRHTEVSDYFGWDNSVLKGLPAPEVRPSIPAKLPGKDEMNARSKQLFRRTILCTLAETEC